MTHAYLKGDSPPTVGDPSPWGVIDRAWPFETDDGEILAVAVSTPGHGGFWVAPKHRAGLPETPYSKNGWYEEDCDWCIPYLALNLGAIDPTPDGKDRTDLARFTLLRFHPALAPTLVAANH